MCCFFESSPAYKGVFLLKMCKHFSLFNVFIWICKYFYCHCIYNSVTNIDFLCLFYFLSFQSLVFPSKIHKRRRTSFFCVFFCFVLFLGGERVCLIGTGTKNGRRGVSSDSTFWMQKKKKVLEMRYLCEFKITYLLCSLQKMLNNFVTVGSSIIEVVKLLNLSVSWNNLSRDKINNKIKFTTFS